MLFNDVHSFVEKCATRPPFLKCAHKIHKHKFDFILEFTGASILPIQIRNVMSQVIEHISIDKMARIWKTIICTISHDLLVLEVNTVVVIFKECGSHTIYPRKMGKHSPPMWPWGIEFSACGTLSCI